MFFWMFPCSKGHFIRAYLGNIWMTLVGNRSREDSHLGHKCVIQCNSFLQGWLFYELLFFWQNSFSKLKYKHENQLSTNHKFWSETIYWCSFGSTEAHMYARPVVPGGAHQIIPAPPDFQTFRQPCIPIPQDMGSSRSFIYFFILVKFWLVYCSVI